MIFFEDVLNPFYVLQIFSLALWLTDDYYKYGFAIVLMIAVSIFGEVKNIYENLTQLSRMARYECKVNVRRITETGESVWIEDIDSSELVPGDVFEVPEGKKLPCDALMLSGQSIINESMLTGKVSTSDDLNPLVT